MKEKIITYGCAQGEVTLPARQCWSTPDEFVKWVETFRDVKFDLDVCAVLQTSKAPNFVGPPGYVPEGQGSGYSNWVGEDGLMTSWDLPSRGKTVVWCNPGFSDVDPWLKKAALEAGAGTSHCFVLTHASTSPWFRDWYPHVTHLWAPYPRVNFDPPSKDIPKSSNPRDVFLWEFEPYLPASRKKDKLRIPPLWK